MVVGLFFYLSPEREMAANVLLFILAAICLITFIFFTKSLVDVGTGYEVEVSAGRIWAYTLILTPIFSLLLVCISILAKINESFKQQNKTMKSGLSEINSTIDKTNDSIDKANGNIDNFISYFDYEIHERKEQAEQEQIGNNAQESEPVLKQSGYDEGLCALCGGELYDKGRSCRVNGSDIEVCLNCYEVINAIKNSSQKEQCANYFIEQLKKNPQTRTYIGPILMSDQKTAEMFEKFLSSYEGRNLFN